jgi:hypothetical protein
VLYEGSRIKLEWAISIALWSEGARKVLKEVGLPGMDIVGGKCKTWLLELLPGGVEEEEPGNEDKDAASKEIAADVENVVAKAELVSVKTAMGPG